MSDAPAGHPTPERIMGMLSAYQQSRILKGAIDLGLFTEIATGADTAAALAQRCGADARGMEVLCDALTVFGLLEKHGTQYRLGADAAMFLDRKSPAYLGGMSSFILAPDIVQGWSDIATVVRRGGPEGLANVAPEHPIWVEFARGMASFMAMPAKLLAKLIVAGGAPGRVLDIAAGHGLYGIEVAKAAPESRITALDWPQVLAVAAENAAAMGVEDRWNSVSGSAFDVPFGTGYDLVLLTNFLHHFDQETCTSLLAKCRDALNPGGRVVTLEFVPNEDGVSPPFPALFAMTMLVSTPKGRAYRYSELEAMHRAAGFARCELKELPPTPQRVVIAQK